MLTELKNFNNKISSILLLIVISNYLFMGLGFFNLILKINVILFFITVIYFYAKYLKNNLSLKIYFLLILLICLGTAVEGWDQRSIYLFHAKRIFFDHSIYSVSDNYAIFSHNDYPLLTHAFAASFAFTNGYWSEVFPKSAYSFLYLAPLIFLSSQISKEKYLIFLSLVIFFLGTHLFDGGIDGLVAIYFVTASYSVFRIFFTENNENNKISFFLLTFLFCLTLTLVKNEGFALLILIFLTVIFIKLIQKDLFRNFAKLLVLFLSLTPFVAWKVFCNKNGIINTDFTLALLSENLIGRLLVFENYKIFSQYLIISDEKSILSILFVAISFYYNSQKKLFYYVTLLFLSYLVILLIVYFSTPYDLKVHLETSANRVVESLNLFLSFFALYNLKILNKTS